MTATASRSAGTTGEAGRSSRVPEMARRFTPAAVAFAVVAAALLLTGTPVLDVLRYAAYAALAVVLPGTLVYRALRRTPHTLVEDLAMGAAVGLVLELAAWFAFVSVGAERWLWAWPAAVVVPFLAVPALRRHWVVRGYTPVPAGWAWAVTGVIAGFTVYLWDSFLRRNPILPTTEGQAQYLDLPFQLSIAGAAKHQAPLDVPQVAGEPLHYHWFGFAHLGSASLVSGVDLPTVFLRLAVPALCALAVVLVAVVGWRVSRRPYVGVGAAVLMFTIGEFGYENGIRQLFGTQVTFIVWGSPSMTYSWVLLLPLIGVLVQVIRGEASRGTWVLAALLLAGSTGAKASSIPVAAGALGITALALFVSRRRLPWAVLGALGLAVAAQLFATAVLFAFESHGVTVKAFSGLAPYTTGAVSWVLAFVAFLLNMQLRLAGIVALLWRRRLRLEPEQVFLLGGAVVGPVLYLATAHPGSSNQYFVRAAFAFGVILSAWGWALVGARVAFAIGFGALLCAVQLIAGPATVTWDPPYDPLRPLLYWALALALVFALLGLLWRGRFGPILLTGVLVAGAPGLVMDAAAAHRYPNGGAYAVTALPASRVEAARWVHDHSDPDDVVATNAHCVLPEEPGVCDARSFWLSAYTERSVLVEGWAFAPRMVGLPYGPWEPFWDPELLALNDAAFYAPTPDTLDALRARGVRWLVVDRDVRLESPDLALLAPSTFQNDRMAVYSLTR
ncbi:hypothetical protein [Phytohabitans suffuscus]|uniref:Uncharacterized protein n=1 Tax=Phytohabitans suffuscus TaxID=624315 RepID=A0A6F8YDH6_9ACTN|nr:hypothetical protein [Phytohabitans suffuscus]BCB84152.1 hypothetical protein Psuf_014650 [Phytohabitans suffuscus]